MRAEATGMPGKKADALPRRRRRRRRRDRPVASRVGKFLHSNPVPVATVHYVPRDMQQCAIGSCIGVMYHPFWVRCVFVVHA